MEEGTTWEKDIKGISCVVDRTEGILADRDSN